MKNLSKTEHQTSIDILEGEIRLAAKQAVLRYREATGRTPKAIEIKIDEDAPDTGAGFEVTTIPGPL